VSAGGEPQRLAAAVRGLAGGVADAYLKTQLHAIAALLAHLEARPIGVVAESPALARAMDEAMAAGDETAAIAAARRLARAERTTVGAVDWAAVNSG
jgi:hypothetical protein